MRKHIHCLPAQAISPHTQSYFMSHDEGLYTKGIVSGMIVHLLIGSAVVCVLKTQRNSRGDRRNAYRQ